MTDIENNAVISDNEQSPEQVNDIPEVNVDNLKAGKIKFSDLPYQDKTRLSKEIYSTLPEEEKELWDVYGYKPKELFLGKNKDGSPKEWTPPEEFRKKIETIVPIKNERIRDLASRVDEGKQRETALQEQVKKLIELNKAKFEKDLLDDEVKIREEEEWARQNNDIDHYEKVLNKKNLLEREKLRLKSFEEPPQVPQVPQNAQSLKPEAAEWVARNQEIVNDPLMLQYAKIKDQEMALLYPDKSLRDRLQMVEDEVKSRYSDKFPDSRQVSRSVEAGRNNVAFNTKPKTRGFADLPELDKKQAVYFIKKGIFKNEADFLKTYEWK